MKKLFCLIIVFVLACVCVSCAETVEETAKAEHGINDENDASYRRTVLYYANEDGLIVPVMKKIPWEEGIGKAALSYLKSSHDNDLSASQIGLFTVIPEGTEIELKIDSSTATVNLNNLPQQSEEEQRNMLTAIVNTLTEFASVEKVTVTADGKTILKETSRVVMNVEEGSVKTSGGNAKRLTLYFPNTQASLNIPITRYVEGETDFEAAVTELLKGPQHDGLINVFPEGTRINSAAIYDNKAIVDVSDEFYAVSEVEGLFEACYDCLYLTASEYATVYDVELRVDSKPYDIESTAVFAPIYANEF